MVCDHFARAGRYPHFHAGQQQLRENIARSGHRPLAMEFAPVLSRVDSIGFGIGCTVILFASVVEPPNEFSVSIWLNNINKTSNHTKT